MSKGSLRSKLSCSECELLIRFGLPCKHYLVQSFEDGASIPRSLIHPRWWINSEPIRITGWVPTYCVFALSISPSRHSATPFQHPYISLNRNQITGLELQVLEAREDLTGYART